MAQRSRVPGLVVTPKGEAAVAASRVTRPGGAHGLADWVAIAQCKCGAIFESEHGGAPTDALTMLYAHLEAVGA
jgi:hypothetical protein